MALKLIQSEWNRSSNIFRVLVDQRRPPQSPSFILLSVVYSLYFTIQEIFSNFRTEADRGMHLTNTLQRLPHTPFPGQSIRFVHPLHFTSRAIVIELDQPLSPSLSNCSVDQRLAPLLEAAQLSLLCEPLLRLRAPATLLFQRPFVASVCVLHVGD